MKRITAIIIALGIITSSVGVLAYDNDCSQLTPILSELNIMDGDENGNLNLEKYVTRAEFVKMSVSASKYRKSIAANIKVSPYSDVSAEHWAAPYIKVAADNGLVSGYSDATFRPEQNVTYEEAATVLLKILGYTDDDFGISWPYGQLGIAEKVGITKGTEFNIGQKMTRKNIAELMCNMLICEGKDNKDYIQTLGYTLVDNAEIISVDYGNNVYTSKGDFEFQGDFDESMRGAKGTFIIDEDKDAFCFVCDEKGIQTNSELVGYLVDTGSKAFVKDGKTTKEYYAKIVTTDEKTLECKTEKLYEDAENSVVKVKFNQEFAEIKKIEQKNAPNGVFDFENKTFANKTLSSNIEILDVYSTDSNDATLYTKVYPQRLDAVNISSSSVLYYDEDDKGRIDKLILKNVTGDMLQYGIMEEVKSSSSDLYMAGAYKYDIAGTIYELKTSGKLYAVNEGSPFALIADDEGVKTMHSLLPVQGTFTELTNKSAKIGGDKYPLASNVSVYVKNYYGTYLMMDLDDLINNSDDYNVTAYADKKPQNGGLIRVLVVSKK